MVMLGRGHFLCMPQFCCASHSDRQRETKPVDLLGRLEDLTLEVAVMRGEEGDLDAVLQEVQALADAERGDLERQIRALEEQLRQESRRARINEVWAKGNGRLCAPGCRSQRVMNERVSQTTWQTLFGLRLARDI